MNNQQQRRDKFTERFRFQVLEDTGAGGSATGNTHYNVICHNCKSRHTLIERRETDPKNLFCTNCGALTPIRTIRQGRGLAAPAIQDTANMGLVQPEQQKQNKKRIPRGMVRQPKNELAEYLIKEGYQVVDSQYIDPTNYL